MGHLIEREALEALCVEYACFNAARALGSGGQSRMKVAKVGTIVVLRDSGRGPGPCNRLLGFGDPDEESLRVGLAEFEGTGCLPCVELSMEAASSQMEEILREAGLAPSLELSYLVRRPEPVAESMMDVERWGPAQADDFLRLLETSGVVCPREVWRERRQHYCTDRFRTFAANMEELPCAWATLFVDGERGYLANAFTQEWARCRGCQAALLARRLQDAHELQLAWVATDVVVGSQSERNCLREGFVERLKTTLWLPQS